MSGRRTNERPSSRPTEWDIAWHAYRSARDLGLREQAINIADSLAKKHRLSMFATPHSMQCRVYTEVGCLLRDIRHARAEEAFDAWKLYPFQMLSTPP